MKNIRKIATFASLAFVFSAASGASLKDAETAFKHGNWKVLRSIDPMSDKVVCTGIYKSEYGIQLSEDTLYISVAGGIDAVTLRFGESPARPLRLGGRIEKDIGSVIVDDDDFDELLESNRLRVEVSTLIRGTKYHDIDLNGIQAAIDNIKAGCPLDSKKQNTKSSKHGQCSTSFKNKMKKNGVNEEQINAICS